MDNILEVIRDSWGWCGITPMQIYRENDFGNILVEDASGKFWRIVPEDLKCTLVAENAYLMMELENSRDFILDWQMTVLHDLARSKFGPLAPGRKYCLKLPGPLGGTYSEENLATISFAELIAFSGDIAKQVKDIPDGTQIKLKVI